MKMTASIVGTLVIISALIVGFSMRGDATKSETVHIVMTGRSTMALWFKHWNWPRFLRLRGTYRSWPIPYKNYDHDGMRLTYREVAPPFNRANPGPWGEQMVASFSTILEEEKPDAAFFKFCFVDFNTKDPDDAGQRLEDLQNTIRKVHTLALERNIQLIIGNALPLPNPKPHTLNVQRDFNAWLEAYASDNDDVQVFDLFGRLADEVGNFPASSWRAPDDHHVSDDAFGDLDEPLFSALSGLKLTPPNQE